MSLFYLGHPNDHDLALFAGGELGPVARWRIEKHLQNCSHCAEAVADFFHLHSELGELSELPNIDWTTQAQMILDRAERSKAANERAAAPSPGHSWALRAGLAMATVICTVVIVRQLPLQKPEPELTSKTMLSRSIQEQAAAQAAPAPSADSKDVEESRNATVATAEAPARLEADAAENKQVVGALSEGGQGARTNITEEFASARRERELAPDLPAPSAPTDLRKAQAPQPAAPAPSPTAMLAYRTTAPRAANDKNDAAPAQALVANEGIRRDQAATAGAPPAERRSRIAGQVAEAAADEFVLADRAGRQAPSAAQAKEKAELRAAGAEASTAQKAQAPLQIASARVTGGAVAGFANTGAVTPSGTPARYSIAPIGSGSQVETGVAADGAISFRTIDAAAGTITITHVYAQ